jgi:hypothetical protein
MLIPLTFVRNPCLNVMLITMDFESRGSSGSIVSDYGLDDQPIPGRGKGFFL